MLNNSEYDLMSEKDIVNSLKIGMLLRYQEHLLRIISIERELKILVCDVARLELLVEDKPTQTAPPINKKEFELDTEAKEQIDTNIKPFDWNKAVLDKEVINV